MITADWFTLVGRVGYDEVYECHVCWCLVSTARLIAHFEYHNIA